MSIEEINVPSFKTSDGKTFEHKNEAITHQAELDHLEEIEEFTSSLKYSDSFKKSLKEHILIWTKYKELDVYSASEIVFVNNIDDA